MKSSLLTTELLGVQNVKLISLKDVQLKIVSLFTVVAHILPVCMCYVCVCEDSKQIRLSTNDLSSTSCSSMLVEMKPACQLSLGLAVDIYCVQVFLILLLHLTTKI